MQDRTPLPNKGDPVGGLSIQLAYCAAPYSRSGSDCCIVQASSACSCGECQAGMLGGIILIHSFIAVEIDVQNVENASEHGGGTA